ncbi:hypothetical protein R1flu_002197 [Riccia fluitans]|uniref:Cytochrome P450 n=1 Tax=Riccia fluitans TaxID=41844 RepID=A0ABD1Y8T3_9MARC
MQGMYMYMLNVSTAMFGDIRNVGNNTSLQVQMERLGGALTPGIAGISVQPLQLLLAGVCILFTVIRSWRSWHSAVVKSAAPKGSVGWPILGESYSFLRSGINGSFDKWIAERVQRFGSTFKTHLFFTPSVIVTGLEDVQILFDDPHKNLGTGVPPAMIKIFGTSNALALNGKEHKDMHKLLADSLLLSKLKQQVSQIDRLMLLTMSTWDGSTVDLLQATQDIVLKTLTLTFFGVLWEDDLADRIASLILPALAGILSVPVYFPGTEYYKARNARKKLNELLIPMIRNMRNSPASSESEKLPYQKLLEHEMKGEKLSDTALCDVLVGTILSGIHGPSNTLCFAVKYLSENPPMLKKVQAEADLLRRKKEKSGETAFSTSDLKDLGYVVQVFHEVLRITCSTPGAIRVANSEMNVNGYVIPKGWRLMTAFAPIHLNPEFYPNPMRFDPDRFQTPPNPKKFLPFGRGVRACVGRELTKLMVVMCLYHMTTKFSWEVVSSGGNMVNLPIARMTGKFELAFKARNDQKL